MRGVMTKTIFALYLTLAASPALARTVEVEIHQQAKDKSRTSQRVTLEVGDNACSSVRLRAGKSSQKVKLCPVKTGFAVELAAEEADLEAHAPGLAGQRTVVARFDRADGSSLEVATTPR